MTPIKNFRSLSFLVFGLGMTGRSVVNFFNKNKIKNYLVWDDENKDLYKKKRSKNLSKSLKKVDYIILSPGINLNKQNNKKRFNKYKEKIITDIDLFFLIKRPFKSIVVTGTNGKSTTCKIIAHLLTKNKYRVFLGGNIGTPVLSLNPKLNSFVVIEASSFQLAYSKFIFPDFALLLNIANDHLDWHGNMKNYVSSKFKIFERQNNKQYSLLNEKLKSKFNKKKLSGKLIIPNKANYQKFKTKLNNTYLKLDINDENMSFVFELARILKINKENFFRTLNSFVGLPHRYEIFLKRKNLLFVNDSKATSFEATKFALKNSNNIYWIVGGLPKKSDKFNLKNLKKNIIKSYLVGSKTNFFKKQLNSQIKLQVTKNLKNSVIQIFKDIKKFNKKRNTILLSPASASFDQFLNFEKRGEEFKKLVKYYARKYI